MIPKVEACLTSLEAGVRKTHIIDGRLRHSLLLEIFTDTGIGTEIVRDESPDRLAPQRPPSGPGSTEPERAAAAPIPDCDRSRILALPRPPRHLDPEIPALAQRRDPPEFRARRSPSSTGT